MNELSVLLQKTRKVIPEGIKRASVMAVEDVVDESPIFSGQLRASTRIGLNAPDLNKVMAPVYFQGAISNPEGISKGRAAAAIARYRAGDTVYISNDQDYATVQEYERGHLMFNKAAARFARNLDDAIDAAK